MIEEIYKKRRKVKRFLHEAPDHNLIVDLMQKTHSLVPSKQNLMPYKIHVLGPKCLKLKDELYHLTTTASSEPNTIDSSSFEGRSVTITPVTLRSVSSLYMIFMPSLTLPNLSLKG